MKGKARFTNAKGLLFPSQFVNLQLELRTIGDAVVVPVSALRNGPSGDFVYVLNDDKTVSQRNVKRGTRAPTAWSSPAACRSANRWSPKAPIA